MRCPKCGNKLIKSDGGKWNRIEESLFGTYEVWYQIIIIKCIYCDYCDEENKKISSHKIK